MRSWTAITKLPVLLSFVYYFMTFAWVIAVNITIGVFVIPTYNFTFDNLGKFNFSLIELIGVTCCLTPDSSVVSCSYHWHHSWSSRWPLVA